VVWYASSLALSTSSTNLEQIFHLLSKLARSPCKWMMFLIGGSWGILKPGDDQVSKKPKLQANLPPCHCSGGDGMESVRNENFES